MKRRRALAPPRRSSRVRLALPALVEDHAEEGRSVVAGQVRSVRGAHQRMAEAIGGALKLDGNERDLGPIEPTPVPKDVVHQGLTDEERQELVNDHPLVVPGREPPCPLEHLFGGEMAVAILDMVNRLVVEENERCLKTGDHQVLVVSRIGDDRAHVGVARQVFEESSALDPELGRTLPASPGVHDVELLVRERAASVDRVEVERWRALVGRRQGLRHHREPGGQIERHVVIQELPHERGARGVGRIVGVVPAQFWVDDQVDRRLPASISQFVLGVQDAAGLADVPQRFLEAPTVLSEEGLDAREHPAEAVLPDDESATGRLSPENARHARRHRRCGHGCEETSATERARGIERLPVHV